MIPKNLIDAVNNITLVCNDARLNKAERVQIENDIVLIQKELENKYLPLTATEETK